MAGYLIPAVLRRAFRWLNRREMWSVVTESARISSGRRQISGYRPVRFHTSKKDGYFT